MGAIALLTSALGEDNGVALKPQMGWSSWSFIRKNPDEGKIEAQALAMHKSLQSHGFEYVNLDDFWYLDPRQTVDRYGRWVADTKKFPNGMAHLAQYVHSLGLKFGMYVTPGIPVAACNKNTPIEGTRYHARDIADMSRFETNYNFGPNSMYRINYLRPGARAFIKSWARLFASWGVDYMKLDGVGIQDVPDILAWADGLNDSGRKIHLALSNTLSPAGGQTWRDYSNSWRITQDIEAYLGPIYPLTNWTNVRAHFKRMSQWTQYSGPGNWNDPDSLEIGNGPLDGTSAGTNPVDFFTPNQRRTVMSWWVITAAPLILGTDLTSNIDAFDYTLLQNDEVLAVNQSGVQGTPVYDGGNDDSQCASPEVWRSRQPDNSYAVLISNPSSKPQNCIADWSLFGVGDGAIVRDLWKKSNLAPNTGTSGGYKFGASIQFNLDAYETRLLRVTPLTPVTQYFVNGAGTTLTGPADYGNRSTASNGVTARHLGKGGSVVFRKVNVGIAGIYKISILYFGCDGGKSGTIAANDAAPITVSFPDTTSSSTLNSITQTLILRPGDNTITISGPVDSYAPDLDSIVVRLQTKQYLADEGQLSGTAIKIASSSTGTDGKKVTSIEAKNSIRFNNINVNRTGLHNVTILYLTGTNRSAYCTANSGPANKIEFPSTSGDPDNNEVVGAVNVQFRFEKGLNTLTIRGATGVAPDLDSIIVAE
jgi:hypothetical protein